MQNQNRYWGPGVFDNLDAQLFAIGLLSSSTPSDDIFDVLQNEPSSVHDLHKSLSAIGVLSILRGHWHHLAACPCMYKWALHSPEISLEENLAASFLRQLLEDCVVIGEFCKSTGQRVAELVNQMQELLGELERKGKAKPPRELSFAAMKRIATGVDDEAFVYRMHRKKDHLGYERYGLATSKATLESAIKITNCRKLTGLKLDFVGCSYEELALPAIILLAGWQTSLKRLLISSSELNSSIKLDHLLLPSLSQLPNLDTAEFAHGVEVDDSAVSALANNKGLQRLRITSGSAVTTKSIPSLSRLTKLKSLSIYGTLMSKCEVETFLDALKGVGVVIE